MSEKTTDAAELDSDAADDATAAATTDASGDASAETDSANGAGDAAADNDGADAADDNSADVPESELLAEATTEGPTTEGPTDDGDADAHPDTALAAERLEDLQRLQAEYVNYKKRVDRDRVVVADRAVDGVLSALMPVLDDIHAARAHGDLTDGPFAAIADKLDASLAKLGMTSFGEPGEEFDPVQHEALMHTEWDADNDALPKDADATTVVTVLQPGYRVGDRVLRPARVAVADPQ